MSKTKAKTVIRMSTTKGRKPTKRKTAAKKYCGRCERTRQAKFFGLNKARPTGLADWCRTCIKEWREERKEAAGE